MVKKHITIQAIGLFPPPAAAPKADYSKR